MGLLPPQMFFSLIMMMMMMINLCNGQDCGGSYIQKTLIVDQQQGNGNHQTIADAIRSIDTNNNKWFKIHINPGTY
ncbi:hypothetical protein TSUD_202020 [Trifolium subterraneum]|uniref:Pectinesterase n=1 Tax=Trifolium subterraneum TaxID=3900 RepID=A0A2Z6M812_TRISU|nr:hypothetical protein TSUD_202020 [Trifolium subterraneum]